MIPSSSGVLGRKPKTHAASADVRRVPRDKEALAGKLSCSLPVPILYESSLALRIVIGTFPSVGTTIRLTAHGPRQTYYGDLGAPLH
jgi:hypothetical protein